MIRSHFAFAFSFLSVVILSVKATHLVIKARGGQAPTLSAHLETKAIDLTYPFDERTIYWPTDKSFHWEKVKWGPSPGGYWYASATYSASEHGGTHLDSPIHFAETGTTAEAIPVAKLIGPAAVIDVASRCERDRDYRLGVEDLTAWEDLHGRIPDGAIVLVRTGWGRFWPDKTCYLGGDVSGDTANLHFPGISKEAAEWLVKNRRVDGVGIDSASLDHGPSRDFPAHRLLNGAGIYGLENVAELDRVPATGATIIALPMKIKGGSGAPVRILAILP